NGSIRRDFRTWSMRLAKVSSLSSPPAYAAFSVRARCRLDAPGWSTGRFSRRVTAVSIPSALDGPPGEARESVVRNGFPGSSRVDERVILGTDTGVIVQRPEADRDLGAVRPGTSKQARAADSTERFDHAAIRAVDLDEILACQHAEALPRDPALDQRPGAGVLAAA